MIRILCNTSENVDASRDKKLLYVFSDYIFIYIHIIVVYFEELKLSRQNTLTIH